MHFTPIKASSPNYTADKSSKNSKGEYVDPLMRWPLRGAAFTNEVGEALRPVIGDVATLTWVPALMYIGADVYDKYKNNQTEYSPNSVRCLKQAIFQGMASVLLPLVAVKAGQNLFSQFGRLSKSKISINEKEEVNELAKEFIANGNLHEFDSRDKECIETFLSDVKNRMFKKQTVNMKLTQKIRHRLNKSVQKITNPNRENNVLTYAEDEINKIISLKKGILDSAEELKNSKYYADFTNFRQKGQTSNVAVNNALIKNLSSEVSRGRLLKTLGGFVALALAIKPIDRFVEEVLIGKVINSGIEKYQSINFSNFRKSANVPIPEKNLDINEEYVPSETEII